MTDTLYRQLNNFKNFIDNTKISLPTNAISNKGGENMHNKYHNLLKLFIKLFNMIYDAVKIIKIIMDWIDKYLL